MDPLAQVDGQALVDADGSQSWQRRTLEARGELVRAVCRAAARPYAGRLASGLPPRVVEDWPPSTWEFLRRHAQRPAPEHPGN